MVVIQVLPLLACSDNTAPIITSFAVPATSDSLTISISIFTATDNVGVTGYLITESSLTPYSWDPNWSVSPDRLTKLIEKAPCRCMLRQERLRKYL